MGLSEDAPFFRDEFPSTLEAMASTLAKALDALIEHDWIEEGHEFYAHLCLEEALVNAVTHGNKNDPNLKVRLELSDEGQFCRIRVFDNGPGFFPECVDVPDGNTVRGRGICLIRHCMRRVTYDYENNCLEMLMPRKCLCNRGLKNNEQ
jgi:serine/threonine-protein kinase RsbW